MKHHTTRTAAHAAAAPTRTVGLYARISDDQAGDAQGVDRQNADGRKVAAARGWAVKEYTDNDVSAFKRKVKRPAFEAMLADLDAGVITGVIAYDLDRLWRQPVDLERAIEVYERNPGYAFVTMQGDTDLSTSDGRMLARVMVAAANKSSADTARRVARKHMANQQAGKPGGGPRPFGFNADRITHHEIEAPLIREAVAYLIAGGTFARVVKDWREAGVKTTRNNEWTPANLRQMLRNPRYVGQRARWTSQGWEQVVNEDTGEAVMATWEGIISVEDWDALQARFGTLAESRLKGRTREGARKYLLSGIARCGACGSKMMGRSTGRNVNAAASYACPPVTHGGCGRVARVCYRVDSIVKEAALTVLSAELADTVTAPASWAGAGEAERIEGLLAEMWTAYKSGAITDRTRYFADREELETELKALKAEGKAYARMVAAHNEAVDVAARWEDSTLVEKRAAVRAALSAVVIHPLPVVDGRKVKGWNPELVELVPA